MKLFVATCSLLTLLLIVSCFSLANAAQIEEPEFETANDIKVLKIPGIKNSKEKAGSWIEYRSGTHIQNNAAIDRSETMNEFRLQIERVKTLKNYEPHVRLDLLGDMAIDEGEIDLRELYIKLPTPKWMAASFGRQIIMWGTGDIIFLNDLFPKDFNSFFMGRDAEAEYMKSPSDALKLNFYTEIGDLDVVYVARFRPYVIPVGDRFVYYSPLAGDVLGTDDQLEIESRDRWIDDDVWLLRYSKELLGSEFALYGYKGFWPIPNGFNSTGKAFYPALQSLGWSLRGAAFSGIWSFETAYYDSTQDPNGDDPLIPNSQLRWYLGYDHELIKDLHLGLQYYNEIRKDQGAYERTLPLNFTIKERNYRMWTMRLTQYLLHQNLTLSLFVYYSPTENDYYLRTNIFYKYSDAWLIHIGSNHFEGDRQDTFWGQQKRNSNVFMGVRYYIL